MTSSPGLAPSTLRDVPYMGVIHVVAEAMKLGFYNGHPDWCNLGQGQPEVGEIEGAPPRFSQIQIQPGSHAYGPVNGPDALRTAVAAHYNRLYRRGKKSRYGPENVSIAAGGRLVLTRIFATLGATRLGYQIPDYTAYEDMIQAVEPRVTPVLVAAREEDGWSIPAARFAEALRAQELGAFVLSNPCNPTGRALQGDALASYVESARRERALLILDEFYSHYIYGADGAPGDGPVSAAAHIDDVNRDPVLLVDGLTKCFRYPGWRVGWAVGPAPVIELLGRAASAIDGGPSQPIAQAAIEVLKPERADQETSALRQVFARKRSLMRARLSELGVKFADADAGAGANAARERLPSSPATCPSTFYLWGSVAALPAPLNDGEGLFRAALKEKVMVVPGVFFDVNPGKRRSGPSPFRQWVRFSFGPPLANVELGLARLAALVKRSHP